MTEEEEIEDEQQDDESLCADVLNLSGALSNLIEIDSSALSSKSRQRKLARMKRLIFDSLSYYCECLPQMEEEEEDEDDQKD